MTVLCGLVGKLVPVSVGPIWLAVTYLMALAVSSRPS
jgi:hypothetical protein